MLSLFDGMGCGRIALERAGIPVDNYFAAEIDKYAIQIAQKNYPEITQLGDVRNINEKMHCNTKYRHKTIFEKWGRLYEEIC